jgi:hypothetical protein
MLLYKVASSWKCRLVGCELNKELKRWMVACLRYYLGISMEEQRKTAKRRRIKSVAATTNHLALSLRNCKEKYLEFIILCCEVHPS